MEGNTHKGKWSALDCYPIGSIYLSVNNVNPSQLFGGTWVAFGQGRTLLGVGSNGTTNYPVSEATGGEEKHQLTIAEMPSHNHDHYEWIFNGSTASGNHYGFGWQTNTGLRYAKASYDSSEVCFGNAPSGGSGSHNNMQPYITTYMWKRTA